MVEEWLKEVDTSSARDLREERASAGSSARLVSSEVASSAGRVLAELMALRAS